uniref:Uncharacterized protein n=1 Tax=Setaria digitata TaxID=48799 RepID=A0A915PFC4_9BILA
MLRSPEYCIISPHDFYKCFSVQYSRERDCDNGSDCVICKGNDLGPIEKYQGSDKSRGAKVIEETFHCKGDDVNGGNTDGDRAFDTMALRGQVEGHYIYSLVKPSEGSREPGLAYDN